MRKETADHYNAIARGEKTVEQALAPELARILGLVTPPVFRFPALTAEEQQLPTAAASIPCGAAEENNDER
jgi:hypothetical protein